jgi:CO dehydrogenase maturation factor
MAICVAVAGKGGTGKTTLSALTILTLRELGKGPILAIDADPDSNLSTLLGVVPAKSLGDLRDDVLKEMKALPAGMTKASFVELGLQGIVAEADGYDLLVMGRGEGSRCYCYLNTMVRKFTDELNPTYAWVVIDNEAGLEHISRRTTHRIDSLIVVVNDSPLSLDSAQKIDALSASFKDRIGKRYVVANNVREHRRDDVRRRLEGLSLEYLCDLPYDPEMESLVYRGAPLTELSGDSPLRERVRSILRTVSGEGGGEAARQVARGGVHGNT